MFLHEVNACLQVLLVEQCSQETKYITSDQRSKAEATAWIIWLRAPMITVGQFVYVSVLEVVFGSPICPLVLVNMIKDEGSMFFH